MLISDEHADGLMLNNDTMEGSTEFDSEHDRMFACEVTRTEEQEEAVTTTPGFEVFYTILNPVHNADARL